MLLQNASIPAMKINQAVSNHKLKTENKFGITERELNVKIMKISLKINDQYPELSKYLEKMPVNAANINPEITMKGLSTYYDSLNVLLNYHIKELPISSAL